MSFIFINYSMDIGACQGLSRAMLRLIPLFLCLFLPASAQAAQGLTIDKQGAVILVYHRIGDDAHPASNIRLDQFQSHMRLLKEEGFNVAPLPEVIAAFKAGKQLPDKTIVITFDGAHRSILENAVPLLREYEFPFTLFVPAAYADQPKESYLSWKDLKKLQDDKLVTLGLQSLYAHLNDLSEEDIKRGLNNARVRFRDEMGSEPEFYAYPFGEISKSYRDLIEAQGFNAGFGQQSGAASPAADLFALPRFTMTETYGDLDRFDTAAMSLPFPVSGIEPADPYLINNNPAIGFTLPQPLDDREDFECFATGTAEPVWQHLGHGRVEIRFKEPLYTDRARINCTVSQSTDDPERPSRLRWFGMLFTVKGMTEEMSSDPMSD